MLFSFTGRRLIRGSVAIIVGLTAILATPQASAEERVQLGDLEKSIVLLQTTYEAHIEIPRGIRNFRPGWTNPVAVSSTCTGFFVSASAHIVTAGHCVDRVVGRELILTQYLYEVDRLDVLDLALRTWRVEGSGKNVDREMYAYQPAGIVGAPISSAAVKMVDFDAAKYGDVAVLQIPDYSGQTPALGLATTAPTIGEPLTSIGFPGKFRNDSDVLPHASFKTGTVSSIQVDGNGRRQIEVNTDLSGGMSGGPTVDDNGSVVGVNSWGYVRDLGNFNFIAHTYDVRAILLANDVTFDQVQPTTSSRPSPTTTRTTTSIVLPPRAQVTVDRSQVTVSANPDNASNDEELQPTLLIAFSGGLAALLAVAVLALMRERGRTRSALTEESVRYCGNCGAENPRKRQFCGKCGIRLE